MSSTDAPHRELPRVEILGTPLTVQGFGSAIERLATAARDGTRLRMHFCTVHTLIEARSNAQLREAFRSADILSMDGKPLVWVARRRGATSAERVCGPDVMPALVERGQEAGLRHYFLGGARGIPEALAAKLTARFPDIVVAGTNSPPFGTLSPDQEASIVASVEAASPDILWIGIGSPRQEIWAAELQKRLRVPVILPVGAAFDFLTGRVRRAPRWMRRLGLEWLFRLAMDPRRLGWRYLKTNLLFIGLIGAEVARGRVGMISR